MITRLLVVMASLVLTCIPLMGQSYNDIRNALDCDGTPDTTQTIEVFDDGGNLIWSGTADDACKELETGAFHEDCNYPANECPTGSSCGSGKTCQVMTVPNPNDPPIPPEWKSCNCLKSSATGVQGNALAWAGAFISMLAAFIAAGFVTRN